MKKILFVLLFLMILILSSSNYETSFIKEATNQEIMLPDIVIEDEVDDAKDEVEDKIVKGTICIDPGHQLNGDYTTEPIGPGSDIYKAKVSNGAQGTTTGIYEYEFTLVIALMLKERLIEEGFDVILTRETHDVNISNSERAQLARNSDLFIRIHADQRNSSEFHGISVLCPSENNQYTTMIYEQSNLLSNLILTSLIEVTQANDMGISYRDDISGFNWSEVPVTLVELGFMSHPEEDVLLSDGIYQAKLVEGMVEGILNYYKK
jgi:N-acetylmuramoyl-L-alanine amidase